MGLFVENLTLKLSNPDFVIEKVTLPPISKGKVDLLVVPGTVAIVGGTKYKGQEVPHKLTREIVGSKQTGVDVYLFPDKMFDSVSVSFFGGQHIVSISSLPTAKAKFSIVGTASLEVADYAELANHFKRSMTRDELVQEINSSVRSHLSNEVSSIASRYITPETTEVTLRAALDSVSTDVMKSRKTAAMLMNMGLILSARGLTMRLNSLDDADDKFRIINDALTDKAIASLNDDLLDRADRQEQAKRQHEVDIIRAQRTNIDESTSTETRNINTNSNGGNVTIVNGGVGGATPFRRFCPECGNQLVQDAKFCPFCGKRL